VNWVNDRPPADRFHAEVKIRYKAKAVPAQIEILDEDHFQVTYDEPVRDATPGQGAVIYDGEQVLGGGIITPPSR
jgi:tRNA-specific 2-thiouridylase